MLIYLCIHCLCFIVTSIVAFRFSKYKGYNYVYFVLPPPPSTHKEEEMRVENTANILMVCFFFGPALVAFNLCWWALVSIVFVIVCIHDLLSTIIRHYTKGK